MGIWPVAKFLRSNILWIAVKLEAAEIFVDKFCEGDSLMLKSQEL